MRLKQEFKPGDKVYATHNNRWGMCVMKVTRVSSSYIWCFNTDLDSNGAFLAHEIEPVTSERTRKIRKLARMERDCDKLRKRLFGSKS